MKKSTRLASVARYGAVSAEENGRIRVRYGRMKLRFRPDEFALFAAEMRLRGRATRVLQIRYNHGRLRLPPQELRRFARMIQAGWSRVLDLQFARLTRVDVAAESSHGQPGVAE